MAQRSLEEYRRKRDFQQTSEPSATAKASAKSSQQQLRYAIQKHDATRLHYDLRLELDGVLLSWAVTKEPSTDPAVKRLAVRTEDHPLSYISFEGSIPKGQYGGGTVVVWDCEYWKPEGNPRAGLDKGHLRFEIEGERLHGSWNLVRMKPEGKRENWLLIKINDETYKKHVPKKRSPKKLGRSAIEAFSDLQKRFAKVQLATLADKAPEGEKWWHEVKLDGYRLLGYVCQDQVKLRTRNGLDWTDKFPAIVEGMAALKAQSAVVDMEAVLLDDEGRSSFGGLQAALREKSKSSKIRAVAFDLLWLNGKDLRDHPLRKRKKLLLRILGVQDQIRFSSHLEGDGAMLLDECCKRGLEGIVSKQAESKYSEGRASSWVKVKCAKRQEFLILGYSASKGGGRALGALYLGYRKGKQLVYAGKAGTGFTMASARDLTQRLSRFTHTDALLNLAEMSPVPPSEWRAIRWVEPALLAAVQFAEWTADGHLRHPVYQGLREDKPATEVMREAPPTSGIQITHPDRIVSAAGKITKGEVAQYYEKVAHKMVPLLARRPLSVVRCPGGLDEQCFYQRKAGRGWGDAVKKYEFVHKGKKQDLLYIEDSQGLLQLVQMGVIEFHPWGARIDDIHHPDRMIFDLDPSPEVSFEAVKLAAKDLKARLASLGYKASLLCTGGKGLHLIVALDSDETNDKTGAKTWPELKELAAGIANGMADDVPQAYVATMSKAKRSGKIFIDHFRNDVTATAVSAYSLRARPEMPVALPISWQELSRLKSANAFDRKTVMNRLTR